MAYLSKKTPSSSSFRDKYNRYAPVVWLFAVYLLCEIIVNPLGEFPLNDDWAYTKALNTFTTRHEINIGTWPAMTLLSQILWGFGFTTVLGFSFFVLRLSTLVSSFIGLIFLYKILHQLSGKRTLSFLGSGILLFSPLYFNLSNTFMTDVNFNTLMLIGIYSCFDYFRFQKNSALIWISVVSILLVLLRQYGILLPFCFFVSCFFIREKKRKALAISLLVFIIVISVLKCYESHLKHVLPLQASYRFSGNSSPAQRVFWDQFLENLNARYKTILYNVLFYLCPVALLLFHYAQSNFRLVSIAVIFGISTLLCYFFFRGSSVQTLNVFAGLSLGTETFVEELRLASVESIHNNPVWFKLIFPWVTVLFSSVTLTFLVLVVSRFWANRTRFKSFTSERVLVVLLFFGYTFFIILTDSYFDRYHIPLITLGIILCFQSLRLIPEFKFSILFPGVMLLFTYASVFGTKDYFTRTRKTWGAYSELCKNPAIDRSTINPGFEIYFWNDGGKDPALWDFFDKNKFTYVLEYEAPEGFIPFRTYKFQRYCPFVEDSLVVFKRGKLD